MAFAFIRADESKKSFLIDYLTSNPFAFSLIALVFFFAMLIHIVLHELLLFKFRDKKTLVKDTGPEQFFYTPDRNFN